MEEFDIRHKILWRLVKKEYWGARHTSIENIVKGLPGHLLGKAKWTVQDMIRRNILLSKPTGYGLQISLNPSFKPQISNFIYKYDIILFQKDGK